MIEIRSTEYGIGDLYAEHLRVIMQRFERALAASKHERVVIFAGEILSVARDDQHYPFRAEPYFVQWLPLPDSPGSILEFEPGDRPRLCFMQPRNFWYEPPELPSGNWIEHVDVHIAESAAAAEQWLTSDDKRTAAIAAPEAMSSKFATVNDRTLLSALDYDRSKKTPYEVACIEQASRIAAYGHATVAAAFSESLSEFALNRVYCSATEQQETQLPYANIIALDDHASVLHYQKLRREAPQRCRSLLIDAGASYHGYASDITRTYAQGADSFEALIESMNGLQQSLCGEVRAGLEFVDLNERAHRLLSEVMAAHELLYCSAAEAYENGITRTFLPHGLGHLLGLQVHDAGGRQTTPDGHTRQPPEAHPYLRLTRRLEEGFILTIEPGIYFIPSLLGALAQNFGSRLNWDKIEAMIPYGGVRIEDNLLVELEGAQNLTRTAFASIEDATTQSTGR